MHEYSIVQALMERIEAEAAAHGARGVQRVQLRIGELSGVETELFVTAYMTFRERTICEHAALDVACVSARWVCRSCGGAIERPGPLRCVCGGVAELIEGDEIVLERIEMEVA